MRKALNFAKSHIKCGFKARIFICKFALLTHKIDVYYFDTMYRYCRAWLVEEKGMVRFLTTAVMLGTIILGGCTDKSQSSSEYVQGEKMQLKVATFNVSMEATNYAKADEKTFSLQALIDELASGNNQQIKNVAEIIQLTQPDIILLNEFDYIAEPEKGVKAFLTNYLSVSQNGAPAVDYPYFYLAPVNTGVKVPEQGKSERLTHFGFGRYPGQYGMVLLSKYPIDITRARTFQNFLWQDMPNNLMPVDEQGQDWFPEQSKQVMRLSSKSHWDLPIDVCGNEVHVLASHPTPPVFDGPEDRNGRRNFDEIRFWRDYLEADKASYHYDDMGNQGGIGKDAKFVILGDLNASNVDGDAYPGAIDNLLKNPLVNNYSAPTSKGGKENKPDNAHSASHTAGWGMRADYVLPSSNIEVTDSGVFWPHTSSEMSRLVKDRKSSSDHRLVWVEMNLTKLTKKCDPR